MLINHLLKKSRTVDVNGGKYLIEEQIGEGAFAYVYKIKRSGQSEHFALKKMICQTESQIEEAKKEIQLLSMIKHENVLALIESSFSTNKSNQYVAFLVLPLLGMSLQDVIEKGPGFPECGLSKRSLANRIISGCVNGTKAIHSAGYRHGDFKPANILLDRNMTPVITDFGSAQPLVTEITSRSQALLVQEDAASNTTASFRAPELFDTPSQCTVDGKTDVWGIGCTIFSMLFSRTPFESPIDGLSTLAVLSGSFHVPESSPWPPEFHTLIAACLRPDPSQRLSIDDLILLVNMLPEPELYTRVLNTAGTGIQGVIAEPESFGTFADFDHFSQHTEEQAKSDPPLPPQKQATESLPAKKKVVAAPIPPSTDEVVVGCTNSENDDDFEFGDFVQAEAEAHPKSSSPCPESPSRTARTSPLRTPTPPSERSLSLKNCTPIPPAEKSSNVFVMRGRRGLISKQNVKKKV